jgi:streptogramin lyase
MLNPGTGKFKEYKIQPDFSLLVGTAVDSKGHIWFIKIKYNKLVKFNPATEEFTEFSLPGKKGAQNIIIDKNDNVWISMKLDNKIAKFDPVTKIFSDYDMPTKDSQPQAITTDSVGNVWFATLKGNRIGRLDISKIGKTAKESELKIKIAPPEIFKR